MPRPSPEAAISEVPAAQAATGIFNFEAGTPPNRLQSPRYMADPHAITLPLLPAGAMQPSERDHNEAAVRARACSAYLGDHTALCRIMGRYKCYVDTRDIGLASHLMLDGYWEMWVTEALSALVTPGMTVADIGANLGYFSVLLADWVGPHGRMFAFEPNPRMHDLLTRTLAVNGMHHASPHRVALGDRAGEAMLMIPQGEPKNAYIAPLSDPLPDRAVRVSTRRLDQNPDWADIELAKIDVEGAEELIWAGMAGLLDRHTLKTVVLEFTPVRYRDPMRFLRALIAPGFSLARIDIHDGIVECNPEHVLAGAAHDDVMLVLRR